MRLALRARRTEMRERGFRRRAAALGVVAATVAASAAVTAPTPADASRNEFGCPDGMAPFPVVLMQGGEHRDKNGNGIICAKPASDGRFHGGPDDTIDDFPV